MKKKSLFDDNNEREEVETSLKVNKDFANRFEVRVLSACSKPCFLNA
jgi:hypothetical protein